MAIQFSEILITRHAYKIFANIESGFDTYKNALIKNLVILFVFFSAFEPLDLIF